METNLRTQLQDVSHGDHCCLLFSGSRDQIETTAHFLTIGLERNERCVYVGAPDTIENLRVKLKSLGVEVDKEVQKERLALSSERDYLDDGHFNPEKMLSFLQQTYDATLGQGFSALRAAGDVSWEVGTDQDFRQIVYYESLLDLFFLGKKMVGMCQYAKEKCPEETLKGILNVHKIATLNNKKCHNFHYIPGALLVEKDARLRHRKRVEWMTSQFLKAQTTEEEIKRFNFEIEKVVSERTAQLRAAFDNMEAFSYSVSHDLRAPIRAIDGFSKILKEGFEDVLGPEGVRQINRICHNVGKMESLIESLLDFSKVGHLSISKDEVDMYILAKKTADDFESDSITVLPLPKSRGTSPLLRQVFANLLSNALKFTKNIPNPHIEVGSYEEGKQTIYYVRDNGIGFDMKHASTIFEGFKRLHPDSQYEGHGVGLALVRRIIEKHGGKIWVESKPGNGSSFYFTLNPILSAQNQN